MKIKFLAGIVLATAILVQSCRKSTDYPLLTVSTINLQVPSNNIEVDLPVIENVAFAWEKALIVDDYNIVFSASENLSDPIVVPAYISPYLISAEQMNKIAGQLGILPAGLGDIYWTVKSNKKSQPSVSQIRLFSVKRLMGLPLTPERDAVVAIHNDSLSNNVIFSWEPLGTPSGYNLILSKNADLSDPLFTTETSETFVELTYQMLQDMIENSANKLKRYKANTIYWNVVVDGKNMASQPFAFKLSGARVFKDVRGDETITYNVVVIPYAGSEMIWMGENLRTRKLVDGTDLVYEGQLSWNSQYFTPEEALINPTTPVPDPIKQVAGMYYRVKMIGNNTTSVVWPSLLAPAGWDVPSVADYQNLVGAANIISKQLEPLRYTPAYPALNIAGRPLDASLMNLWDMNMTSCGANRIGGAGSLYLTEFAYLDGQHMVYATKSVSEIVTLEPLGDKGNARAIGGLGHNAPVVVRLIYKGDDD